MSDQPASESLSARIVSVSRERWAAWRVRPAGTLMQVGEWRLAVALVALIALGPLGTILAANVLSAKARDDAVVLQRELSPRESVERIRQRERAELVALLRRPGVGVTLDALARAMPPEASLVRVERNAAGQLEVDIAAPDPDGLRAALRREPALAGLRDAGQRQSDATMLVSFRERGQ